MHINIFWLFIILMMLERTTQYREPYRIKRPYKIGPRYRPKSRYRPRWHPPPRKRYKPPVRYSYYNSHGSHYSRSPYFVENDYYEDQSQHQPYVIEIELPKKFGKPHSKYFDRHYDRNLFYDEEYLDDDDDYDSKFIKPGHRRLKLRGNKGSSPKLRIKISRVDNKGDSEESNSQEIMNTMLPLKSSESTQRESQESSETDWFSKREPQVFPTVDNKLPTSQYFRKTPTVKY